MKVHKQRGLFSTFKLVELPIHTPHLTSQTIKEGEGRHFASFSPIATFQKLIEAWL